MKIKEIRDMSTEDLKKQVLELKNELFRLNFAKNTNKLENPKQIKAVKKDIAKVKTIIKEREILEAGK